MILPRLRFLRRTFTVDQSDHRANLALIEDWAEKVRALSYPRFHGAGKTNATDNDIKGLGLTAQDGMMAIVHDDTTGFTWLSGRDGGNWRHVQLT